MREKTVSPEQFEKWIAEMIASGLVKTKTECADLMGKSSDWMWRAANEGVDKTAALAMRALLHNMKPYE